MAAKKAPQRSSTAKDDPLDIPAFLQRSPAKGTAPASDTAPHTGGARCRYCGGSHTILDLEGMRERAAVGQKQENEKFLTIKGYTPEEQAGFTLAQATTLAHGKLSAEEWRLEQMHKATAQIKKAEEREAAKVGQQAQREKTNALKAQFKAEERAAAGKKPSRTWPPEHVFLTVAPNPKKAGTKAEWLYSLYAVGRTVAEFYALGGYGADIKYNVEHGFITVGPAASSAAGPAAPKAAEHSGKGPGLFERVTGIRRKKPVPVDPDIAAIAEMPQADFDAALAKEAAAAKPKRTPAPSKKKGRK